MIDLILILSITIPLISISIALIALWSYLEFRNWRFLLLSVSFFLLAVSPIVISLIYSGLIIGPTYSNKIQELKYLGIITGISTFLAFALLSYVYSNERKTQSIRITRTQWLVGGILSLAEMGYVLFVLILANEHRFILVNPLTFLLNSISTILTIYIVISLFSFYRARKNENTLVVMTGFVCLLLAKMVSSFPLILIITNAQYPEELFSTLNVLVESIYIVGFIAFLVALLRLKVFR